MALPILETTKHTIEVPSTKKKIEIRPFLVREEKILIQAQQSNDDKKILKVIKEIISVCSFEKIKPNDLTLFDLEYIFLQLRAISVGETVQFNIKCEECGKTNIVDIDLTEAKIIWSEEKIDNKIELTDEVGLTLRPIRVKDMDKIEDDLTASIIASIESIYDADSVHMTDEANRKELVEFVDSLSHSHLELIQKYIENQPKLEHTFKYTCIFCGHENEHTLSGLSDFFI
jgi:hypothetical protein